jgi:putative hydrolase of the HAD superfamily
VPSSPSAVDALLFDLGNIVIDIDFSRVFDAWARAAGVPPAAIAKRFSIDAAYEAHERGEIEGAQYLASLRKSLEARLSDEELLAGWNAIFVGPREGMRELLQGLSSVVPLYVFSNTNALHHAYWSEQYRELLQPFSRIFCSHQLGVRKPSPEAFRRIAQLIGIAPSRLAFFDDLRENVDGAREAGLPSFHVTSFAELHDALTNDLRIPLQPRVRTHVAAR